MPTPFSSQDLSRVLDARSLTKGRALVLAGAVEVSLEDGAVVATVQDGGQRRVRLVPSPSGRHVAFERACSCGAKDCAHLAAAGFAALDRFPALRRAEQQSFLDTLVSAPQAAQPAPERHRIVFEVTAGPPPHAFTVATQRVGLSSGAVSATTPSRIATDPLAGRMLRDLGRLLGAGDGERVSVSAAQAGELLGRLAESGHARWREGGKRLSIGPDLVVPSIPAALSGATVIRGNDGAWYVEGGTGVVGRLRVRPPAPPRARAPAARPPAGRAPASRPAAPPRRVADPPAVEQMIVARAPTPVLHLTRMPCPDPLGRVQDIDALTLAFDYGGVAVPSDDDRQFVRIPGPGGPSFVRRDTQAEAAALEVLRRDGFVQMRLADARAAKGRMVFAFRGRDAGENWQRFVAERLPALQAGDWRSQTDPDFGPRLAQAVGDWDVRVADAPAGHGHAGFSLDFGIEIDGARHPLLPILLRLRERGGLSQAQIVEGDLITSLDDGRILKLPAERVARLLALLDDLIDAARRGGETLVLPAAEASAVLDLEDIVGARWQDGAAIATQVARLRGVAEIAEVDVPPGFAGELRPYQQEGLNWLQHLRRHAMGGLLADDMGLGKTAQTIAHIAVEHQAGRLTQPALVVVPTSLVANWSAELARFAPHLRVLVLHGLDRHARRADLASAQVAITTYTVLARDIDAMAEFHWSLVVLDEAQAIKNPAAKATHAVCRLTTGHRLCLSGTPIENNLGELWSQFAFLMPGLLGSRKSFGKRFRTPIEKAGNPERRGQLAQRIRPFILRRTKAAVASELPPKHTILRRITLAPEQRELYETIRATLHTQVRDEIAAHGLGRSHVMVLDALLKLRQVCCDPRLVKLAAAARLGGHSSKLDDVLEMVGEMIAEGRRILLFSQFTSMLDLMKPRLSAAGIDFVELRGDTRDRAAPVNRFQAGEVPLFLISLKAGGRGLNLTAADTVIHYDPWWNPAVEDQASDRAHRIGQTKSVFVYKLIATDTVEERIVELQERKAALASVAFGDDAAGVGAMAEDDIEFLFGPPPNLLAA